MLQWGRVNGVMISDEIEFREDPIKGICAFANKNFVEPRIMIPNDLIITGKLAHSLFPNLLIDEKTNNTWLKMLLCKMKFDKDDHVIDSNGKNLTKFFQHYLRALPKSFNNPIVWKSEELQMLRGTNLGNSIREKFKGLYSEWYNCIMDNSEHFDKVVIEDELKGYEDFDNKTHDEMFDMIINNTIKQTPGVWYSMSAFLWSYLILISRAFPEYIINGGSAKENVMLLPILDLLNHDNYSKVNWEGDINGNFIFTNECGISEGDEIFNNYGGKGNEELLNGYGFVLEHNLFDNVLLRIKFDKKMIKKMKQDGLKLFSMKDFTWFAFDNDISGKNINDINNRRNEEEEDDDGITLLINNHSEEMVTEMLNIFSYVSVKNKDETYKSIRPQLAGVQVLRNALEYKIEVIKDPIGIKEHSVDRYRRRCCEIYKKGQIEVLNNNIKMVKHIEKKLMKENSKGMVNIDKIMKHDVEFIEKELINVFKKKNDEVVFDDNFQILVIWIIVKIQNNSFPKKYQWVGELYNKWLKDSGDSSTNSTSDSSNMYEDIFIRFGVDEIIGLPRFFNGYNFIVANSFTRLTNNECILVGPVI